MKIPTIFNKNLKIVSRNWNYFTILFICPILLILLAGLVLNSVDFSNIKVGIVDKSGMYDLNLEGIRDISHYDSLTDCLTRLTNSKVNVCIYINKTNERNHLDIYLDNSQKIIEYYSKQIILNTIFQEQSSMFEEFSGNIDSRLSLYSTSISNAKNELFEVKNELNEQERMLVEYRENLTNLRQDFDAVYWPIKQKEPEISRIKLELENKQSNLENNVTEIRNDINSIQSSLNVLDNFLSSRLISQDYNYSRGIISSVRNDLNSINSNLENIESNDYNEIISLLNDFELIIKKLDSIKSLLDKLDYDLANSIENTRQGQLRVNNFIEELNNAEQEINLFKNNMPSSSVSFEFKKAINISNDPVLIAFPFLVAIIITFTSLVISNIFVLKQVNQASYLRDISTPVKDHNFLIAEYLVNLFFILIQVLVLFVLGFYWFNIPLELFIPFTLSIFLVSTTFIFLGMSLGYLIKSQNLSMLITIFCVMALLIFSDLLVPAILSGPFIKFFVSLNPFLILKIILQNILIFNTGFKLLSPEGIWVIFSIIISMVILIVSRKHSKKKVEC